MAPIFFRQGSNNIKIGTVCQRQGGANPETADLYMRQGAANPLVYRKAASGLYCHNCTVTGDPYSGYTLSPIDNKRDLYAFFQYGTDSEAGYVSVLVSGDSGYFSDTNYYLMRTLPTLSEPLAAKPNPATSSWDLIASGYTESVWYGENSLYWYNGKVKAADDFLAYYPGSYISLSFSADSPYTEGGSWSVSGNTMNGGVSFSVPNPNQSSLGGYLLIYNGVNPEGEVGALTVSGKYFAGVVS